MTDYVRGSTSPPQSFGLQLRVTVGRNQIQRQMGNFAPLYQADGAAMQETNFELEPTKVWQSNPQETYTQLVVSTSGTVYFEGVLPDLTKIRFPVNKLLVLDTELKAFRITNANTERVRGNLCFVSTQAQ